MTTYSYSLQYAHFDFDEEDDQGASSSGDILSAYDGFDWPTQVMEAEKAENLQKCAPTFTVKDLDRDRLFWVSAYGIPDEYQFVCYYSYFGEKSILFGLFKKKGQIAPNTRELSPEEARRAVRFFVTDDDSALLNLVSDV